MLVAGDHLLGHISSNPLISRPLGGRSGDPAAGRPRALVNYIRSLKETQTLPAAVVLPGHGELVTGHAALIDERLGLHERRAEKILGLITEQPRTAHELAQAIWGNVAVTQAFLTLSEVLGHVDLLLDRGLVAEEERGGVVRFAPREAPDNGTARRSTQTGRLAAKPAIPMLRRRARRCQELPRGAAARGPRARGTGAAAGLERSRLAHAGGGERGGRGLEVAVLEQRAEQRRPARAPAGSSAPCRGRAARSRGQRPADDVVGQADPRRGRGGERAHGRRTLPLPARCR